MTRTLMVGVAEEGICPQCSHVPPRSEGIARQTIEHTSQAKNRRAVRDARKREMMARFLSG